MTKLKPNDARIIVRPIEQESRTASGILIPENAKQKPIRGEVVAVGPGAAVTTAHGGTVRIPLDFQVGQIVVFDKYAGLAYKADPTSTEELLILRAHDVLATEIAERLS